MATAVQEDMKTISQKCKTQNPMTWCPVTTYQITETGKTNFIKGWQWPPGYKVPIKIMKESRKPPDHNLMVWPPFYKLSQHKFIMLLSYRWQYLDSKQTSVSEVLERNVEKMLQSMQLLNTWNAYIILLITKTWLL